MSSPVGGGWCTARPTAEESCPTAPSTEATGGQRGPRGRPCHLSHARGCSHGLCSWPRAQPACRAVRGCMLPAGRSFSDLSFCRSEQGRLPACLPRVSVPAHLAPVAARLAQARPQALSLQGSQRTSCPGCTAPQRSDFQAEV